MFIFQWFSGCFRTNDDEAAGNGVKLEPLSPQQVQQMEPEAGDDYRSIPTIQIVKMIYVLYVCIYIEFMDVN